MEHLDEWLEHLTERDLSPRTVAQYRHKVRQFEEWRGARPAGVGLLAEFRDHLQTVRGLNPATIRVTFLAVYGWLAWREERGLEAGVPRRGAVRLPRLLAPSRDVPTRAEIDALWDAARRRMPVATLRQRFVRGRVLAVLACLDHCGIRREELLGLHVSDVREGPGGADLWIRRGKGGQARSNPLPAPALEVLRAYLLVRQEWAQAHGHATDALFPVDRVRVMGDVGLTTLWRSLKVLAGLGDRAFGVHGVRHRFATDIYHAGGAREAQLLLGHASLATTERHYLHAEEWLRDVVERRAAGAESVRTPETGEGGSSTQGRGSPDGRGRRRREAGPGQRRRWGR